MKIRYIPTKQGWSIFVGLGFKNWNSAENALHNFAYQPMKYLNYLLRK